MIKQSKKIIHRALSVLLIAVFLLSENAVAQPFPAVTPAVPDPSVHSPTEGFVVPPRLGSIQEYFKASENAPFVLLIQDAHAVIDAQHSIQSLIGYIQKHYGVKLIAVEGGAGKMDTTLLHTYPDDFIKRQVFERYLKRAEVSGIEMAAVLNSQRGTYYGIEDWELYELNYAAYLRVHETREDVQQILRQFREEMDRWRRELYTPELNEFHERLQAFEEDRAHLLEFLKYLTRVNRVPSIGYEHLAPLMESAAKDESEEEIKNINASVRSMAESFRRGYFSRIPREVQMEFNQKNQAHKTGQMEDGSFLKYIVEVGKSVGLEPKLPLLLRDLVGQAETLSMIRGTRVFDELKQYLEETENKLLGSVEQRDLADKFKKLRFLENLVKLELIRDDWEKLNASPLPENWRTRLGDSLAPAMDYYRVALQRDAAFKRNLADQMRREKTRSAIVLAGGFHTVGFIDALKAEGYSYAVITPKIESLDGHEAYDDVMQGRLSYADNLETTLYDAFMRHASLQMVSDLDQSGYQRVLKVWRDEVIRALASEGRIREAGKYTRYIDRLTRVYHEKFEGAQLAPVTREQILAAIEEEMGRFQETTVKEVWEEFQMQIDQIGQSLRALAAHGDLSAGSNRESIRQALRSPTATLNTPRVLSGNRLLHYPNRRKPGGLSKNSLSLAAGAVRSEMRMQIPQEFSQVTETNRTEVGRGIQSFLKEAVAQRKNDDVLVAWYLSQALNSDGQKDNLYSDERLSEFFEAFQGAPRLKALILDGWIFSEFESVPAWHPLLAELFSTYSSFLSQAGEYYSSEDAGILYALAIRHIESSEFIRRMRTSDVRGEFKARYRRNYNVDNPIAMVRISGGYELFDKEKTPRTESFKVLEFANKENPDKLGAKLFRVRETTYSSQKPADALRTREPAEGLYAPDWTNDPSVWTARVRDSIIELIGKLRDEGIQSMAIGEGGIFKGTMVNGTDLDTNLFIVGEPDEQIRQRIEASFSSILEAKGVKLSEAPRLVFIAPDSETVSYEIRRDERGVFIVTPTGQTSFHYKMLKTESITVNLSNGSAAVQLPSRIQAGLKYILINFGSKAYQSGVRLALQELSLTKRLEPGVRIISRSPAVQTVSEDLDARKSADLLLNLFGKENLPKDSSDVDKIRNLESFLEGALREMDRLAAAVENTLMRRIEKDLTALAANLAQEGVENPKAVIANLLRQLAEPPTEDTQEWSNYLGRVQQILVNYPLIVDRASKMLPAIAEVIARSELRTGEGLAINMQPLADFPDALQAVSGLMRWCHMAPSNIWIGDLKDARVPAVYDSDTRAMIINSRYLNPGSFKEDVKKMREYRSTKDFEKLFRLGLQAAVYADFDEGSGYYSAGADPYYNREFWRPQLPRILYALGSKSEFFRKVAAAYFSGSHGGVSVSFLLFRALDGVWNMAASLISGITGWGMIREIRSGATVPKTEWPVFAGEYLKKLVGERGAFPATRTNAGLLYGANFEPEIRASLETALQELVSEEQATGHPSVASSYKGNVWDLVIRSDAMWENALGVAGEIISRAKLGPSNLLSVLRENRSLFFREEGYYKKLRAHLPELLSARRAAFAESRTPQEIVITIVGAGFNEEALSTAMVLEEMFKAEGINRAEVDYRVEVFSRPNLVFDRLVTASRDDKDYPLIYPDGAMEGVSKSQKDVYFEYDAAKKAYRPRKELTQRISYQEIDLLAVDLPAAARQRPADIIALHHVLTYLEPELVPLSTRRIDDFERNETRLQSLNVAGKVVKETIYAGILNEQDLASATPIRVEGSISESEKLVHDLSAQKAYLRKTNPEGSSAQDEVHLTRVSDLDRDVRRYAYEEAVRGMMSFFYEKLEKNGRLSIISDTGTQTPIARYLELGFANRAGVPFLVKTLPDFPSLDQAVRISGPDSVRSELRSEVPYLEVEPFWASEIPADKEAVENMLKRVRKAAPQDLPQAFRAIQRAFESGEKWDPLNRIDQQSDLGLARRNAAALFLLPAAFDYFMDANRRLYLESGISIFMEENYETVMWNMLRLFFLQVPQKIFRNPTVTPEENARDVYELLLSRIQRLAPQQESGTSAAVKKRKATEMEALHNLWKAHVHSMQDLQWFIPAAFRDAWYGNHLAQQHGVFTNLFEHEVLIDAKIYPTLAKIGAEAFVWWRPEPESKDFTAVIRFRKRRNTIQSEIAISSATGRVVWSPQGYQSFQSKDLKELKWGARALKEIRTFVTARINKDSEVGEPDPRWIAILDYLESRSELRGLAEKDLIYTFDAEHTDQTFLEWFKQPQQSGDREFFERIIRGGDEALQQMMTDHPEKIFVREADEQGRLSPDDGRTVYLWLERPFQNVQVLRLKAVRPSLIEGTGDAIGYGDHGRGFVPVEMTVQGPGRIEFRKRGAGYKPFGGAVLKSARAEYENLMTLRKNGFAESVDVPLAVGRYSDINFQGQPLGFVVIGMTGSDRRLMMELQLIKETYDGELEITRRLQSFMEDYRTRSRSEVDSPKMLYSLGQVLRRYHDAGFYHQYPHFRNFGVTTGADLSNIGPENVIIRDLSSTVQREKFESASDDEKASLAATYRWIDIAKIAVRYLTRSEETVENFVELQNQFLKGYFGEDLFQRARVAMERLSFMNLNVYLDENQYSDALPRRKIQFVEDTSGQTSQLYELLLEMEKDLIPEEPPVRDMGRSELGMAAYERGEPIPEADLKGRYEATKDFIFMDGIYYVQNNGGLQNSLKKVREEINKKESQDKIVVLADGINRWNLEFLHSFHTVSALYQLNNLSEVLRDQTLLDLGAGSGVLGITALLKGARNVIAVDMDEEVLEKAAESLRLTEEANGMSKGALQSRFSPVKMKYDDFAEMIQKEDFQFLKTRVSSSPVVINNNHDPFNADNVIAKIMGPWLDARGKEGIPAPARFVLAGLAYEQRDDYDDEETEEDSLPPAFVNILRARYGSALRGWVLKEVQFSQRDVYVGFTFEAPGKRSELRRSDSRDTYYALGGSHFKVKVPSLLSEAYLIELIGILNDVGPSKFDEAFAQVMRDISESAESNRDQLQRALRRLAAGVLQEIQSLRTTEELITFIDSPEMERMIETQIQSLGEMPDTMKQKIAAQLLAELLRTALDGLRYGRAAAPAIKAFSALPAEDLQALQEMTNAYSREGVLSLRDLELGIRELASSENYSGVADLQLGSEALLIDAAFVPNPKDPAFLQVLRFLQAFSQERTLVLSYRPGTPQEIIVQELRQKLGFAKALLAPVDSDSRIILSKIPSEIVSGMRFMVSIGTVIVAPNREAGQSIVISNNAMSADPVFGRHEEIGREQGFLMLAVMILGSPHLMQWLEDRGKNNPREMNADVFSRFVSFMADLAKTNAIRQAVAASA